MTLCLPSVGYFTECISGFADTLFAERASPSVTLGKVFAEWISGFAECPRHSANSRFPVVMLAILVAAITYQVGLSPPGGFWSSDGDGDDDRRHAGGAVLLDASPWRFQAFLYCNTASFMASMALILLLVNPNLHRLATIRWWYPLYACQLACLLGLVVAYAAGSARSLRTSVFVFALIGAVVAVVVVLKMTVLNLFNTNRSDDEPRAQHGPRNREDNTNRSDDEPRAEHGPRNREDTEYRDEVYAKRKYLMLLGILAASVTYQAGLAPPGGVWQDDGAGAGVHGGRRREAGNAVLHDTNTRRYHMFFYSNSTSFIASVVVIALLLQETLGSRRRHCPDQDRQGRGSPDLLLAATNTAVVLELLGLLAAYAAGSTREWESVVVLTVLVVLFMAIHAAVWLYRERRRCGGCGGGGGGAAHGNQGQLQMEEQAPKGNGHSQQPSQGEEA